MERNFEFDLQLFGGGGSTTVTERELTPEEREIIGLQRDYIKAVSPNALKLNDSAANLLFKSLGDMQVDFKDYNNQAQQGYNDAYNSIKNAQDLAYQANNNAYNDSIDYQGTMTDMMRSVNDRLNNAADVATHVINNELTKTDNLMDAANGVIFNELGNLNRYRDTQERDFNELRNRSTSETYRLNDQLDALNQKSQGRRDDLYSGNLPQAYKDNMQQLIASMVKSTGGAALNDLANRGVINSSMGESAINRINQNAANAAAQQFLTSIGTLNDIVSSDVRDSGGLIQNQMNNIGADIDRNANMVQNIFNNNLAGSKAAVDYAGNLVSNNLAGSNAKVGYANNLVDTGVKTSTANLNQANALFNNNMAAANARAGYGNTNLSNTLTGSNALTGLGNSRITTAAAAQEAAQSPAVNLWNMSLGLNGAGNGTLAALSGKGTTTTTTSGGGLFSGLLGGLF